MKYIWSYWTKNVDGTWRYVTKEIESIDEAICPQEAYCPQIEEATFPQRAYYPQIEEVKESV